MGLELPKLDVCKTANSYYVGIKEFDTQVQKLMPAARLSSYFENESFAQTILDSMIVKLQETKNELLQVLNSEDGYYIGAVPSCTRISRFISNKLEAYDTLEILVRITSYDDRIHEPINDSKNEISIKILSNLEVIDSMRSTRMDSGGVTYWVAFKCDCDNGENKSKNYMRISPEYYQQEWAIRHAQLVTEYLCDRKLVQQLRNIQVEGSSYEPENSLL